MDIADRRELFVDDYLLANRTDLALQMHRPQPREIVMVCDQPWEGSETCYQRIIRVGDTIRMYYMGADDITREDGAEMQDHRIVPCLATSADGIHWVRPDLGLFDFDGAVEFDEHGWIEHPIPRFQPSKHNNIVWSQPRLDNFTPFLDTNPACLPDERYKAVGFADPAPQRPGAPRELFAYKSADGIHWSYLSSEPIFSNRSDPALAFDTENNAFWDPLRQHYWCYMRGNHSLNGQGVRDIQVATSTDFRTWTKARRIKFDDAYGHAPALYTNQIEPYYRNPEVFVGFPARYSDRIKDFSPAAIAALPGAVSRENRMKFNPRYGTAITDTLLMTSRDGYTFHLWDETFVPPGPEPPRHVGISRCVPELGSAGNTGHGPDGAARAIVLCDRRFVDSCDKTPQVHHPDRWLCLVARVERARRVPDQAPAILGRSPYAQFCHLRRRLGAGGIGKGRWNRAWRDSRSPIATCSLAIRWIEQSRGRTALT